MALVTDIVAQADVTPVNVGASLSLATPRDYFFMIGAKELIDGAKNLLAVVEQAAVNSENVDAYISGATSQDYYTLKAFQELFDALGL